MTKTNTRASHGETAEEWITRAENMLRLTENAAEYSVGVGKAILLRNADELDLHRIDWVIIGAETGKRPNKVSPNYKWIHYISMDADNHCVRVYMKDNTQTHLPDGYKLRKEFPEVVV